jgi:hypothetical protein
MDAVKPCPHITHCRGVLRTDTPYPLRLCLSRDTLSGLWASKHSELQTSPHNPMPRVDEEDGGVPQPFIAFHHPGHTPRRASEPPPQLCASYEGRNGACS